MSFKAFPSIVGQNLMPDELARCGSIPLRFKRNMPMNMSQSFEKMKKEKDVRVYAGDPCSIESHRIILTNGFKTEGTAYYGYGEVAHKCVECIREAKRVASATLIVDKGTSQQKKVKEQALADAKARRRLEEMKDNSTIIPEGDDYWDSLLKD